MAMAPTIPTKATKLPFLLAFFFCLAVSGGGASDPTAAATSSSREFRFVNRCNGTVWVGSLGSTLINGGGWAVGSGRTASVSVPLGWHGRFWARTGCRFGRSGTGRCETGDCGGLAKCSGLGGEPPATLAEFSLGPPKDFYDVSLVDGYNVRVSVRPMGGRIMAQPQGLDGSIRIQGREHGNVRPAAGRHPGSYACRAAGCDTDVNAVCPPSLRVTSRRRRRRRGSNSVVACRSACNAFSKPQFCCTGAYGSPGTCGPSVFSRVFKRACPRAYTYAYDDPTSIFTCDAPSAYAIYFC